MTRPQPLRPCPRCGTPRRGRACPSPSCGHVVKVRGDSPTRPDLATTEWQRTSARILKAWREEHGDWCPGWIPTGHPPHDTSDLTVHHVDGPQGGALTVLCRSENSSIGSPT